MPWRKRPSQSFAVPSTHKRTLVTALKIYVKPEDQTAYYVINETFEGKIPL